MKLSGKLFLSYLGVIVLALVVASVAAALLAPRTFDRSLVPIMQQQQRNMMDGQGLGQGLGQGMGQGQGQGQGKGDAPDQNDPERSDPVERQQDFITEFFDEIRNNFQQSINQGLMLGGVVAILGATLVSLLISRQVVRPVQAMATASQRIADGHYDERLGAHASKDELGDMMRSFNQMAQALDDTEQMRRQLIADVSHELKTPLASIKGYMEGLQDGVIDATPEVYGLVHREADRLQRLVLGLQELSRAEADQLNLELHPTDAARLVTSAADFLRPQYDDKGVTLTLNMPDSVPVIEVDFDRMRQALLNIMGNALQYTPQGGRVDVAVLQKNGNALFAIQDSGVGLAPEDVDLVFQRFYRADKSRARQSGGSGIGLTITRHIIEAHGGAVRAESAGPGQGSTFHITLPMVE